MDKRTKRILDVYKFTLMISKERGWNVRAALLLEALYKNKKESLTYHQIANLFDTRRAYFTDYCMISELCNLVNNRSGIQYFITESPEMSTGLDQRIAIIRLSPEGYALMEKCKESLRYLDDPKFAMAISWFRLHCQKALVTSGLLGAKQLLLIDLIGRLGETTSAELCELLEPKEMSCSRAKYTDYLHKMELRFGLKLFNVRTTPRRPGQLGKLPNLISLSENGMELWHSIATELQWENMSPDVILQ